MEWHKSNKSENEGIDSAPRRFKREVSKAGIFPEIKQHRHFETPIEKHKRKEKAKHKQRKRRGRSRYWGSYLKIQSRQIEIVSFFDT